MSIDKIPAPWTQSWHWPDGHRIEPYGSGDFVAVCPTHCKASGWITQAIGLLVIEGCPFECTQCGAKIASNPSVVATHLQETEVTTETKVEAVAWCALTPSGSIQYFDGRPMVMVGKAGNYLHPVALYPEPPKHKAVSWNVLHIGNRGAAYDPRDAKRAFSYDHQPGNIDASKLGRATEEASRASAGDSIDRGLALLKALQAEGFGVFQLGPEVQSSLDALRGEVERLRRINSDLVDKCNRLNLCGAQSDQRAGAAERRVAELEEVAGAFLEAADARDNEETSTQYPEHERRLRQYRAAREDIFSALTKETP